MKSLSDQITNDVSDRIQGTKPCCNIRRMARRFAASFISVQMHTSFTRNIES